MRGLVYSLKREGAFKAKRLLGVIGPWLSFGGVGLTQPGENMLSYWLGDLCQNNLRTIAFQLREVLFAPVLLCRQKSGSPAKYSTQSTSFKKGCVEILRSRKEEDTVGQRWEYHMMLSMQVAKENHLMAPGLFLFCKTWAWINMLSCLL